MSQGSTAPHCLTKTPFWKQRKSHLTSTWNFAMPVPHSEEIRRGIPLFLCALDDRVEKGRGESQMRQECLVKHGIGTRQVRGWSPEKQRKTMKIAMKPTPNIKAVELLKLIYNNWKSLSTPRATQNNISANKQAGFSAEPSTAANDNRG